MGSFDFILSSFKHSHSSAKGYETCNYSFYLTYIQAEDRKQNFYGQYGIFSHKILEKFFKDKLAVYELAPYYRENYEKYITLEPPSYKKNNASQEYYDKGLNYFENFSFDKSLYEIILIEEALEFSLQKTKVVVKPDLILKEKSTGKYILVDFKTANAYKNGKLDKGKMKDYLRQFYLYAYGIWLVKEIAIDEIHVWFITCGKTEIVKVDAMEAQNVLDWFYDITEKINQDEEWKPYTGNPFFCNFLCSVKYSCPFWEAAEM
jgi:hypothetical protein